MDITEILTSALGGGAVLTGIVEIVKTKIEKKMTPYDMFMGLMKKQTEYIDNMKSDLEKEKLDIAEKSSVIMQSHFCKHRFKDPSIICPVDEANDKRLHQRCVRCDYTIIKPQEE